MREIGRDPLRKCSNVPADYTVRRSLRNLKGAKVRIEGLRLQGKARTRVSSVRDRGREGDTIFLRPSAHAVRAIRGPSGRQSTELFRYFPLAVPNPTPFPPPYRALAVSRNRVAPFSRRSLSRIGDPSGLRFSDIYSSVSIISSNVCCCGPVPESFEEKAVQQQT
jgi:hypothetical protein